jgi:hypothetical protein
MTSPIMRSPDQGGFVVELDKFSGPLDLLLHLIREDEVDITDLPIAKIADQFLAVISDLGLNQAADYLEMAARLLRIKAQMLLPRRLGDDDWEDPSWCGGCSSTSRSVSWWAGSAAPPRPGPSASVEAMRRRPPMRRSPRSKST